MTSRENGDLSNIGPKNSGSDAVNLIKTLNEELEELDDEEFQLPHISELPSLDSILNEEEDEEDLGSLSDSETCNTTNFSQNQLLKPSFSGDAGDTASVLSKCSSETKSRTSSDQSKKIRKDIRKRTHGSIIRHVVLKGIASQLVSAHDRVGAGLPTTMTVGSVICIGTSHGLILIFEATQAMKWCLGSIQQGEQYGAISALSLNQDSSKLLAGFAKGHICLYDVVNGKLLQNIPDAHTPFTAVLHLKWTDCPGLALLCDSGGSVFELSIKRTMGLNSNESRCIFSGSRGEVCTLEPLMMGQFLMMPPIVETVIVAMATISKLIVVSLRPQLKVLFSHPLKASSQTLPLLSWQFVIIQMGSGVRVIDPVLAFGREDKVYFYQLTHGSRDEMLFIPLQRMTVSYMLQSLTWLNARTMAVMDNHERLHIIDVKNQEELDVVDLARLGLVYASQHFKGISTGGNVSKAMSVCGERACYHSVVTFGSQILLLGTKSFQVVTMRSWVERIEYLIRLNLHLEALQLGLDILKDKAQAIVGLSHKKAKREKLVCSKLRSLLLLHLEKCEDEMPERSSVTHLTNYYQKNVQISVMVAVEAEFADLLFGKIWDTYCDDSIARGIYLDSLEPYILNDQIYSMPPSISQYLLTHYEDLGNHPAIEACVVHLDIVSLDLHQTMTICWAHGLYDAIFYVYTRGMQDYVTPLEELLTVLKSALDTDLPLSDIQISLGNKILVYISCCLAGRAYPHGNIDPSDLKRVKHEVFKSLTSVHTKNSKEYESPHPFLRTLLRFDTREFLNVLAIAFEEDEFTTELGLIQQQRVVDILMQVMVGNTEFSVEQLSSLFTFIARQICRQQGSTMLNRNLLDQVLIHLTLPNMGSHHEERETALIELLREGLLPYDQDELLQRAENAHFYRVCESIHEERKDYENILSCYINDDLRKNQVFTYIKTVLTSPHFTKEHRDKVKEQILVNIKVLLTIEVYLFAKLLLTLETISSMIKEIVEIIRDDSDALYSFLQAIFTVRTELRPGSKESKSNNCISDTILYPELLELYIELMCSINPNLVYSYIKSVEGYRLDNVLDICQKYNLDESTAYLFERRGDIKGAFNIHIRILRENIDTIHSNIKLDSESMLLSLKLSELQSRVVQMVRVCHLGSSNEDSSILWFSLLDILLELHSVAQSQNGIKQDVRGIVGHVVNSMMTHISLPAILERIMQDPGYSECNFGQIKHLLRDMVERYTYEDTLYSTVVRIIRGDQLNYLKQMEQQARLPLSVSSTACAICRKLYGPRAKINVFSCEHSYHTRCGGDEAICIICSSSLITTKPEHKEHIGESSLTLNSTQLDGLEKVSILDSKISSLNLIEELKISRGTNIPSYESQGDPFSDEFRLKLAPPSVRPKFDIEDL